MSENKENGAVPSRCLLSGFCAPGSVGPISLKWTAFVSIAAFGSAFGSTMML